MEVGHSEQTLNVTWRSVGDGGLPVIARTPHCDFDFIARCFLVGSMGEMLQERRHPLEGAVSNLGLGEQAVRREQLD
jgi:hypothetical protein